MGDPRAVSEEDFASTGVSGTIARMGLGCGTVVSGDGRTVADLDGGDPMSTP